MRWEVPTMRSATSFFDKTLIRTDVRRYWPLLFVYTGVWMILLPVVQWSNLPYDNYAGDYLYQMMFGGMIMALISGVLMAMALYSYTMNSRSIGLMHSLPVTRHTQFFSHFIAGMGMMTVGKALVVLASLAVQMLHHNTDVKATLLWFAVTTLLELFFFSLSILCCMLTGWLLAVPVVYAAANSFAIIMTYLLQVLGELFYFGYSSGALPAITRWLTPVYALGEVLGEHARAEEYPGDIMVVEWKLRPRIMNPEAWPVLIVYTVVALAFLLLAWHLYRKRASESAGDAVAFGWARPIFRYGIAVYGGLAFGFGLFSLLSMNRNEQPNTLLLLVCVILMGSMWYFIAEMLIRKAFRIFRKSWPGALILSAALVAVCVAAKLDITGYESRIPNAEDIESVEINIPAEDVYVNECVTADAIDAVIALHQAVVAEGTEPTGTDNYYNIRVTYELKDGSFLSRRYTLSWEQTVKSEAIRAAAEKVIAAEEIRYASVLNGRTIASDKLRGGYVTGKMNDFEHQLTAEEAQRLYEALMQDLANGAGSHEPMQEMTLRCSVYVELDAGDSSLWIDTIRPDFTETLQVLMALGVKEEQLFVDDWGKYFTTAEASSSMSW